MSRNKRPNAAHFGPTRRLGLAYSGPIMQSVPTSSATTSRAIVRPSRRVVGPGLGLEPLQWALSALAALAWAALCAVAALCAPSARAQSPALPEVGALQSEVQNLLKLQPTPIRDEAHAPGDKPWRVEFELGQLDPRLKLAPCERIRAYLPEGAQVWGRTRVGLRCEQGPVKWNVYWPVTVKVWGQALVAVVPLRPGQLVNQADLRLTEVDLASSSSPALKNAADIVGRSVVRGIEPGQSIRQDDVRARRWFASGDTVRLNVVGAGFQVVAEGLAISHGDEGRCARIRTDNGKVLCGMPVGERLAELTL
jgi:flagella basal body P-ring formation protein FlgA